MPHERVTRRRLLRASGVAVAAGIAGCGTRTPRATDGNAAESAESGRATAEEPPPEDDESAYTSVYRDSIDAVVLVEAGTAQGSGFVFRDGRVVTNAHVVDDATEADVRFRDGTWVTGDVVGVDAYSDLAVVGVSDAPESATPLPLAEGRATVGQEVVVIGNPFGLDGTVTAGIVSGVNRSIPSPTGYRIPDAVQTDAAVNPGNSGGPIVSLDGEVVAVINSGGGDNVAFGISAALTRRVVDELVANGEFRHSYLGVAMAPVTPEIAAANGIDPPRGVLVRSVLPGSPAEGRLEGSAGREAVGGETVPVGGDVLLAVDGTEIRTAESLGSYLALHTRPGDTASLTVLRNGTERLIRVELGARPDPS